MDDATNSLERLDDLYTGLIDQKPAAIFVAPPIRFAYKKSDYLYLFYKDLLDNPGFSIKSVSTAGHLKFIAHQLFRKPCILHYHWISYTGLQSGFVFFYKLFCIWLYKLLGGKLVWTIHNKLPLDTRHEWVNYKARKWLAKKADRLHVECDTVVFDVSTFFNIHPRKIRVWPHPQYPPQLMPRAAAVEAINHRYDVNIKVQDRLFLMFGHISAYKQIDKVCEIFLNEPIQKKLIIVGPVKKGQMKVYKNIRKYARQKENIILIPQFIKEDCVPEFMNAADYLVFNYKEIFSSGGIPLAKSYNKPIILPNKGCLKDLDNKNLTYFSNQNELKEIIQQC